MRTAVGRAWVMRSFAAFALLTMPIAVRDALASDEIDSGGCLLSGRTWAVALTPPERWTIECHDPTEVALEVTLWPTDSSWPDAVVVMYVKSSTAHAGASLKSFADDEAARFKREYPAASVRERPSLRTRDGQVALVRYFTGDEFGNHEAVAYLAAGPATLTFVLSSGVEREYQKHLPDFEAFVTGVTVMQPVSGD